MAGTMITARSSKARKFSVVRWLNLTFAVTGAGRPRIPRKVLRGRLPRSCEVASSRRSAISRRVSISQSPISNAHIQKSSVPTARPPPKLVTKVGECNELSREHGRWHSAKVSIDVETRRDAIVAAYIERNGIPQAHEKNAWS
jgi:hypothetical protein